MVYCRPDITHPCLTPDLTSNHCEVSVPSITAPLLFPMNTVGSFLKVNEADIQIRVPLYHLFDDVTQHKNLLCGVTALSIPCLLVPQLVVHANSDSVGQRSNQLH